MAKQPEIVDDEAMVLDALVEAMRYYRQSPVIQREVRALCMKLQGSAHGPLTGLLDQVGPA